VYHNPTKYTHTEIHQDIWENHEEPFVSNQNEVYIKLELDAEAVERVKQEESYYAKIGVQGSPSLPPDGAPDQLADAEEAKEEGAGEVAGSSAGGPPLPGERAKPAPEHDNILIACAPYPNSKAQDGLPRYLTRIRQVDCELEGAELINQNYTSYLEGVQHRVRGDMAQQACIWLKPEFNCPQGATVWVASQLRKVSVVSKAEYLQEQKQFFAKQVSSEHQPLQAGKYQLLGKYDFVIPEKAEGEAEDTIVHVKVDTPADRDLLNYMRLKIVDRSPGGASSTDTTEAHSVVCLNSLNLADLKLKPNGASGYSLLVEGVMPYNTAEGQLVIDTLSNSEAFALQEVVQCEPLEYVDAYVPTKYGVIFQEKIVISPSDHTSAAMNIKLLKGGQEFGSVEGMASKYFRVDILDNGEPIYSETGYNQITLSHFMFRCNQGLPDEADESDPAVEVKHNYVVRALFDLHEWPAGKTQNEESDDITWQIKVYSSETLALIKDTDKEDREKALKASWEAEEPGRAEKAKLSRQRFLLRKKQLSGEELTEEELEVLQEKRERVRKKDQEEAAGAKGGKGGKAPPAKGKGAPPAKGAAAHEEEAEAPKADLPRAEDHYNDEIHSFLQHFASARKITQDLPAGAAPRKRSDSEKKKIEEEFESARTAETESFAKIAEEREQAKESRQAEREEAFKGTEEARETYKTSVGATMDERNKYREGIDARKAKETTLLDLLGQDKADVTALRSAIDAAVELRVKDKYIKRARKFLQLMEYVKDFEAQLQAAVADKNKDLLQALLERVDSESAALPTPLPIDAKVLNDAKGNLAKMK